MKQSQSTEKITLRHPMHAGVSVEIVHLTPQIAARWLGENTGNRNKRRAAISAYSRDMSNGKWLFTGEPIKFDWNGRLIDGQHRCEAVIVTGQPVDVLVVYGLDPDVQEVLDTNMRRTAGDALLMAGIALDGKNTAAVARVGIAYETGQIRTAMDSLRVTTTHSEIKEWVQQNTDVAGAVALAGRVCRKIGATAGGLGYAALVLSRIDAEDAVEFFESSAETRGFTGVGDPRVAMLNAIAKIREHGRVPTGAEILAIVFRAWNKWREGKNLKLIRLGASDGNGGTVGTQIVEPK